MYKGLSLVMSLAKSENHNFVWLECRLCFNRHVVTYTPARYHGEPRKGVYEAQALKEHLEMILPSPLGVWGLIDLIYDFFFNLRLYISNLENLKDTSK